jgi:hypothetical protein
MLTELKKQKDYLKVMLETYKDNKLIVMDIQNILLHNANMIEKYKKICAKEIK